MSNVPRDFLSKYYNDFDIFEKKYGFEVAQNIIYFKNAFYDELLKSLIDGNTFNVEAKFGKHILSITNSTHVCLFKFSKDNRLIKVFSESTRRCDLNFCSFEGLSVSRVIKLYNRLLSGQTIITNTKEEFKKYLPEIDFEDFEPQMFFPYFRKGELVGVFMLIGYDIETTAFCKDLIEYLTPRISGIVFNSLENRLIKFFFDALVKDFNLDCYINLRTRRYHIYHLPQYASEFLNQEGYWHEMVDTYGSMFEDGEFSKHIEKFSIDYMRAHITKENPRYSFIVKRIINKEVHYFRVTFAGTIFDDLGKVTAVINTYKDETDIVLKSLQQAQELESMNEQYVYSLGVLNSLASVYYYTAFVDFKKNVGKTIFAGNNFKRFTNRKVPIEVGIRLFIKTVDPKFRNAVSKFMNPETLPYKFHGRKNLSIDVLMRNKQWSRINAVSCEIDSEGIATSVVFAVSDIDEEKTREEMLIYRAEHDALTGVMNRSAFDKTIKLLETYTKPIALLIIDVDYFKTVNDTYGHDIGDKVLKEVAKALVKNFDSEDAIARLGGDEFCAIMTDITYKFSHVITQRINHINYLLSKLEGLPQITISAGAAFSKAGYSDRLFLNADKALYLTKNTTKSGCTIFKEKL